MNVDWIKVVGGFGLFLLSLRFLNRILETSIANSLKPLLKKLLSNRFFSILTGIVATVFVQASSISIIATMGLLGNSIITLEQGFLVMLGATLGTTIKGWFFAISFHKYGLLALGICSIFLIIVRRPLLREVMEVILSIALAFLALDILSQGLQHLLDNVYLQKIFQDYTGGKLQSRFLAIALGCIITMAVQSSSAIVFLVLELSRQGVISYDVGAALILGSNIGTTITPFIASLEYDRNVKRLAVAHILVKVLGVFITLLLFPTFLLIVDYCITGKPEDNLVMHLAAIHTTFNFINMVFWGTLSGVSVRFLFTLIPSQSYDKESQALLPVRVRRMLARHPQRAFQEIDRQILRLQDMTKSVTDNTLEILIEGPQGHQSSNSVLMHRRFESFKEVIYDLLVRVKQNGISPEHNKVIDQKLHLLADFTNFYSLNLAFKDHVEHGILVDQYQIPSEIKNLFQEFQKGFNEIWLRIVLDNFSSQFGVNLKEVLKDLENLYSFYLSRQEGFDYQQLYWIYETIRYLRHLVMSFYILYEGSFQNKA